MVNGVLGEHGDLVPLPVEKEGGLKQELAITRPLSTVEKVVTLMDQLIRNRKFARVEHAQV